MSVVFHLQIVDPEGAIAQFRGMGPVERDLIQAVAAQAEREVAAVVSQVQARGRWWVRPAKFDAAVTAAVREALPGVLERAITAVLWDVKRDATAKYFQR